MGNYGIKIGLPGQDVRTAEDKDIAFSSKYNTLKIFKSGTASVTTNGSGNGSVDVGHGLGFSPGFFVWRKGTASWQSENAGDIDSSSYANAYFPNPGCPNNWIAYHERSLCYSDNQNLTIEMDQAGASTTYNFGYYIFADLAEAYNNESQKGTNDYGIRIATPGKNALEQKDFQLGFSSRFRALQYNLVKSGTTTLTLPAIYGSQVTDPSPEEACYAEITHGLGYPPFFLAYFKSGSGSAYEIPYAEKSPLIDLGYDYTIKVIDSWCDSTRIRFSFLRRAYFDSDDSWSEETITIKYLIFNEDLSQL